jgi:hypothetical protein
MPDITFDSLDSIPEGLREGAKQVDGKFVVNAVLNSKLQEFRNNNIEVVKDRDTWKTRYEKVAPLIGDDVEKFASELPQLRTIAQQVADGKLKGSDAIEAAVKERVENQIKAAEEKQRELDGRIHTIAGERDEYKSKFERSVLDQQITNAILAQDSVANPAAMPDILARAAKQFVVQKDGTVLPMNGDKIVYGADGVNPMSPNEWLTKLVSEAPYLGKASAGGGAAGGSAGVEGSYGMSQADFQKLDPSTRIRLAREAQQKRR